MKKSKQNIWVSNKEKDFTAKKNQKKIININKEEYQNGKD